ncbi:transposase [Microbacterium sp. YMB-B2]|uniref:Transposase n=1 Tax=Microbacterium tenebrionis TaxID=2830665 RepID=A0A9X1LP08_9MICO|nr:transposase [Microbacterium tenebrionis]MCC2029254.1 transposase [Microbacterium tenebrionis]
MAAKPDGTLEEIAAELYALPPREFTAVRDARAKQLTDAALAKKVGALRKPLLAAWVVNLFAREQTQALGGALELAAELRDAQDDRDARALTALGRQRRALVRALAQQASELASSRGEKITQATTDAVERTLNAAMFHAEAALAVASGRLIRPLDAASDDTADVSDAVAGDLDSASAAPTPSRPDELAARRARKAAEDELRTAERALRKAEQDRDALERKAEAGAENSARLSERLDELEKEIERTRQELDRQKKESGDLEALLGDVREGVRAAQQGVSAARKAVDRL